MKTYKPTAAIERMNALAANQTPFLFVIDYSGQQSYIEPLENLDPSEILYDFRGDKNTDAQPVLPHTEDIVWQPATLHPAEYQQSFETVHRNLLAGNSYLTNLTCRIPVKTNLSMLEIFQRSKALYKLWMKDSFVCFSPEIFIRIEEGRIMSFPMKGTLDATLPHAEQTLMDDPKESAEHATIVDLIRNDLSMVAHQVTVDSYRYIDRLMTNKGPILQTSSRISGILPTNYREQIGNILFSQLPAGSITGAPKKKTVEIIAEAETYNRNFYTGIMGIYHHDRVDSAVMIRFIEQESDDQFCFKAGGGITAQSQWENEYNEVIQKIYVPIY